MIVTKELRYGWYKSSSKASFLSWTRTTCILNRDTSLMSCQETVLFSSSVFDLFLKMFWRKCRSTSLENQCLVSCLKDFVILIDLSLKDVTFRLLCRLNPFVCNDKNCFVRKERREEWHLMTWTCWCRDKMRVKPSNDLSISLSLSFPKQESHSIPYSSPLLVKYVLMDESMVKELGHRF